MDLDELRAKIDGLDAQIITALNERAKAAQAIGELKRNTQAPIYVPEREKTVFNKLSDCNTGPLDDKAIQSIYREVISAIRALEKPTSVAFLGPPDTFSHMAARRIFGVSAEYYPLPSFQDVFTEVERRRIDYGIVPVESSMGGSVSDTLDSFISSELKIVNEVLLHITQNLLANCTLKEIRRVYSGQRHTAVPQRLRANLPGVELVGTSSTAEAAAALPGTERRRHRQPARGADTTSKSMRTDRRCPAQLHALCRDRPPDGEAHRRR